MNTLRILLCLGALWALLVASTAQVALPAPVITPAVPEPEVEPEVTAAPVVDASAVIEDSGQEASLAAVELRPEDVVVEAAPASTPELAEVEPELPEATEPSLTEALEAAPVAAVEAPLTPDEVILSFTPAAQEPSQAVENAEVATAAEVDPVAPVLSAVAVAEVPEALPASDPYAPVESEGSRSLDTDLLMPDATALDEPAPGLRGFDPAPATAPVRELPGAEALFAQASEPAVPAEEIATTDTTFESPEAVEVPAAPVASLPVVTAPLPAPVTAPEPVAPEEVVAAAPTPTAEPAPEVAVAAVPEAPAVATPLQAHERLATTTAAHATQLETTLAALEPAAADPIASAEASDTPAETLDADRVGYTRLPGFEALEDAGSDDAATFHDAQINLAPSTGEAPPELPETIDFAVSPDDVFIALPGSDEKAEVSREADTISVDFPEEDVRAIIRDVADLYELNVIIPETLVGTVSLKLRNVTWRQVFEVVLEPLNFTYIEDGNIIKIKSREDLLAEPVDTRVFIVNFAKARALQETVKPLVDPAAGGRMQVDQRSNALIITERPSRMNDIQVIIETLDKPTEQVMIESKFVEVRDKDNLDLGINWSSLAAYEIGAGPFQREYEKEDSRNEAGGSGVQPGSFNSFSNTTTTTMDSSSASPTTIVDETVNSIGNTTTYLDRIKRLDTALFTADQFKVVLSALKLNSDVELISNPTVVTMNNAPARINIGEEFPLPKFQFNRETGQFEVNGFEFKDIGIILDVTPQINGAGFITLDIEPTISNRSGVAQFENINVPIISTRTTKSMVTIKSGYTLAIGGLIEKSTQKTDTRVPVLGDIPGVGRLFRSESMAEDNRNLIIFITAKILSASGATYRDVFSQRRIFEMGIRNRDLPGYEPPQGEAALLDQLEDEREALERQKAQIRLQQQLQLLNELKAEELEETREAAEKEARQDIRRRYR